MPEAFLQIIDTHFAEFVYTWESTIVFIIGIVINLLLWYITPEKAKKSRLITMSSVFLITVFIIVYAEYVKNNYSYLPAVNYRYHSYQQVEQHLGIAGFKTDTIHVCYDSSAEEHLKQYEEPYSYYFKVTCMEPSPNTFVKKDTSITLYVTWKNDFNSTSVGNTNAPLIPTISVTEPTFMPTTEQTDFDAKQFYGDISPYYLFTHNTDEFTLYTSEAVLKMSTDENESRSLGVRPASDVPMEIQVINYETGELIESKQALLGDDITFSKLPTGIYYYIVKSTGYQIFIPDNPFRLEYNSDKQKETLSWVANLEKNTIEYSLPFKIQLQNEQGKPISNISAYARVESKHSSRYQYTCIPVTTDENGYLSFDENINKIIDFQISNGYSVEVSIDKGNTYFGVTFENGIGICKISDR